MHITLWTFLFSTIYFSIFYPQTHPHLLISASWDLYDVCSYQSDFILYYYSAVDKFFINNPQHCKRDELLKQIKQNVFKTQRRALNTNNKYFTEIHCIFVFIVFFEMCKCHNTQQITSIKNINHK